jgi:hypothetical protein
MLISKFNAASVAAFAVALCAILSGLWPGQACAAAEEIVVFTDEFEKPGRTGYELHFNFAARARRTPDYPGEQPPDRVLRFMPEVVWGLSEKWNLGLHVPMSRNTYTGSTTVDGFKARLQYLNAQQTDAGSEFHGANYELSYFQRRLSESRLVAEVRGIAGWRRGNWLVAVNPILNHPLDAVPGVENRFNFDLFGKVMKTVARDVAVGLEHYSEFGALRHPSFGSASGQTSYAVLEFTTKSHFEIHVGFGHGWTHPVDKRVYKVLVGLPF